MVCTENVFEVAPARVCAGTRGGGVWGMLWCEWKMFNALKKYKPFYGKQWMF